MLEYISLYENRLISLDANLFDRNPNLRYINLAENLFKFISSGFFNNLKWLKQIEFVSFDGCDCVSQVYDRSKDGSISSFEWENDRCINYFGIIKSILWPIDGRVRFSLNNENCMKEKLIETARETKDNNNKNTKEITRMIQEMEDLMKLRLTR